MTGKNKDIYTQAEIAKSEDRIGDFELTKLNGFYHLHIPTASDSNTTGWKFHISVDPADVPRATNIVADIIEKYGAHDFKIIDHSHIQKMADPEYRQAGKFFTIYDKGEKNWPQILRAIEREFRRADIHTGPAVKNDRPVAGSLYISYRNDSNVGGGMLGLLMHRSSADLPNLPVAQRYNPDNVPDPFKDFDVVKSRQRVIPEKMRRAIAKRAEEVGDQQADDVMDIFSKRMNELFPEIVGALRSRLPDKPTSQSKVKRSTTKPKGT